MAVDVPSGEGRRPVVLLVDDEPDVLESLHRLVGRGLPEADIHTASSGTEGLEIIDDASVDLIVSDYKMPEMDGIEFLHWASRREPGARRVMLTAFAEDEHVKAALAESFVDRLIPKTVPPGELVDQLSQLLSQVPLPNAA